MRPASAVRAGLFLVGVVVGSFGAWSLLRLGLSNLLWTVLWLGGGVLLNDVLVAGLALGLVTLGLWLLPRWARGPAAAGLVVLGTVTLMAVPVLGRFGARSDNPSLLDRSYGTGWVVLAGIVAVGVMAASALAHHRRTADVDRDDG